MTIRDPERARKRRRLILGLASLPVLLAAVVVAVYLFSLPVTAGLAIRYYESGSYEQSKLHSSTQVDHNLVETWIPYFNRGDAKAADQDYTSAVDDFEKALDLAPQDRKCAVRVNLSRSWEDLGDIYEQGGYHQGAVQLYQAAKDVIAAAGDECPPSTPEGQALGEAQQRLDDKQAQAQAGQDANDAQNPGGDDKLDQLGQKQQQGEQDKQNDGSRGDGSGAGSTDKPW